MHTIETEADIATGAKALANADPVMRQVLAATGLPALRRRAPGFAGLMRIIAGQQLSVAAAAAIWAKMERAIVPMTADTIARTNEAGLRACGFSRPKIKTARHICAALEDGTLDLTALPGMPVDDAIAHLCQVKGIGPWTAEIYLLFCLGNGDIWPAGDLALQVAVQDAYGLGQRPSPDATLRFADRWRPWRGVAACALWEYYKVCRSPNSGLPV